MNLESYTVVILLQAENSFKTSCSATYQEETIYGKM